MDLIQLRDAEQLMLDNIEWLTREIAHLREQRDAAQRKWRHLANCCRLLQQSHLREEEKKQLEEGVIWMNDKMKKLLDSSIVSLQIDKPL